MSAGAGPRPVAGFRAEPRGHPVTIRDVARLAGASVSTVSAALNGTDYVSVDMRRRIRQAVARLHYRPNDLARSLRMRRSRTLAVVVPDLSNTFYSEMLRGMEDYAASSGYTLLIGDSRESWAEEKRILEAFGRRRVDGVVRIPAAQDDARQARALLQNIPVVYADRLPSIKAPRARCVGVDNERAAAEAIRYLLGLGHRRIAIVTGPLSIRSSEERLEGYRRAMRAHGVSWKENHIRVVNFKISSGVRTARALLTSRGRPTAIFCANNTLTLGAVTAVQELGLRCPEEISLIGFDDTYWATLVRPRLTMVSQPAREMGATAARILVEQLARGCAGTGDKVLPTRLMIRDSCAPPPGRTR